MRAALFLILSFSPALLHAQVWPEKYMVGIATADSLYDKKEFLASALHYSRAFKSNSWKGRGEDRYNAACSWALAGNVDSAFVQLHHIAGVMTNLGHLTTDTDLEILHADKRWQPFIDKVKRNKELAEVNLNKPLARELDSIFNEDQLLRQKIDAVEKQYGRKSKEMDELWSAIMKRDASNLRRVTAILDEYGWLGRDVVGGQGSQTLFLVIQHADQKTQEKYLPMMREAVKNGKAEASNLALLEDRVAVGQGRKQIYGSQIHFDSKGKYTIPPIEDEPNVNKRRSEVGLEPLERYLRRWGIDYKVPKN